MGLFNSKKQNDKPVEAASQTAAPANNAGVTVVSNNPAVPVNTPTPTGQGVAAPPMVDNNMVSVGAVTEALSPNTAPAVDSNTTLVSPEVNYNNTIPGAAGSMQPDSNNLPVGGLQDNAEQENGPSDGKTKVDRPMLSFRYTIINGVGKNILMLKVQMMSETF